MVYMQNLQNDSTKDWGGTKAHCCEPLNHLQRGIVTHT